MEQLAKHTYDLWFKIDQFIGPATAAPDTDPNGLKQLGQYSQANMAQTNMPGWILTPP